jgi:predicted DNA binding CopG/RHH family protein
LKFKLDENLDARLASAMQAKGFDGDTVLSEGLSVKKVPRHRSEDEEREFCSKADSTDYIDWKEAKQATFSKLKPSLRTISLRLPEMMIEELKLLAIKMDGPYQTLIKFYLSERIRKELESANA